MADFDKLQERVAEVLLGAGSVRTVPAGILAPLKTAEEGDRKRALQAESVVRFDVVAHELGEIGDSPPVNGDKEVVAVEVLVTTWHQIPHAGRDYDARKLAYAAANDIARVIRRALEWPGNVLQTAGGQPTGLLSGMLVHQPPNPEPIEAPQAKVLELTQRFTGFVINDRAIT